MTTVRTTCGCIASTPPDIADPQWAERTPEEFEQAWSAWADHWQMVAATHEQHCVRSAHYYPVPAREQPA